MHQRHWKRVVEEQRKVNEHLRAALKPFADYARRIDEGSDSQGYPDACPLGLKPEIDGTKEIVHLRDCREARRLLAE